MGDMPDQPLEFTSYEDFGRQFFATAVSKERILAGVNVLAGEPIVFGPIGAGPGRIAKVTAHGTIEKASIARIPGELVRFRVELPVSLSLAINLQLETQHFDAGLVLPLVLTARAVNGCAVFIEALPPRDDEITVDLHASGLRASLLQRAAGIEGELRRFVAKYVARELEKPRIRQARLIDVAASIDSAWAGVGVRTRASVE